MLEALQFNGGAVVVTGGGTGIGQACCVEFAKLGAKVVATGRTRKTLEETRALIDVDLTSVFLMSKAFLPLLRKHGGGASIVNNASVYGLVGNPLMPVYCAAKGGVLSLTRQLACDYGPENIRVNAVCPGPAWSPRVRGYIESGKSSEARLTSKVLLGRIAECSEIANTMVFLASDAASYIHGTSLAVDGGYTIQ